MRFYSGLKQVVGAAIWISVVLSCYFTPATATTLYVDLSNPAPLAPYTNWLTAATNIQDAVDAAVDGDSILVTNGVYASGGQLYGMTNRVAVTKPVTVQSVNGPEVTFIVGYQVPTTRYGAAAIRCVYLTNGAVLTGFTLTNGATASSGSGGGVFCESASAVVSNCVIAGNAAASSGGGAYSGTLYNCTLSRNSGTGGGAYGSTLNNCTLTRNLAGNGGGAYNCTLNNCALFGNSATGASGGSGGDGGGAYNSTLRNCTVTGNAAYFYSLPQGILGPGRGGGIYGGTLFNCILYYNSPGGNYFSGTMAYCCTTPLPGGTGNTNVEPQLASLTHLSADSPCRGAGNSAYATGTDIDGEPWATPPSMGCDEYWSGSATGALSVAIIASTTFTVPGSNVTFQAAIQGRASRSMWDRGDGTTFTNQPYLAQSWPVAGDYTVTLRAYNDDYPEGVATNVIVQVIREHYVSLDSASPTWPYGSWQTAATNIQHAVDAAASGAVVWVSNGMYQTGARAVDTISNRVVVAKPVAVRSVNGPEVTVIWGSKYSPPGWARCAYLTNGAVLAGFTLTNGTAAGAAGGGAYCGSVSDVLSNCVIVKNGAGSGGGVAGGTLYSCTLKTNSASYGGGASGSTLNNCLLMGNTATGTFPSGVGGGAESCTLSNCALLGNAATQWGGGAYYSTLNNCALIGNSAAHGGGALDSKLTNCTLVANSATQGGGGANAGTLRNCILCYNAAPVSANYAGGSLSYCCTTPLPFGAGNFTDAPLFVDTNGWSNLRLQTNSPCINAGNNAYALEPTDLDGNLRIAGGRVDVGAYEFQGVGLSGFTGWLWQYGLPTDGSAEYADTDTDRHNNWQEWVAGTNPTNAASVLLVAVPTVEAGNVTLTWLSVTDRTYYIERTTDLASTPAFSLLQSNIPGLPGTTSFTDTNPPASSPALYRVGVQP